MRLAISNSVVASAHMDNDGDDDADDCHDGDTGDDDTLDEDDDGNST